jgi:hypothetical protein
MCRFYSVVWFGCFWSFFNKNVLMKRVGNTIITIIIIVIIIINNNNNDIV